MKKKNNLLIAFIALITLLSFGSCKKAQNDQGSGNKEKTTTSVLDHIKSLGYKDSEIKDIGDDYLVDGDIMFSKKAIIESKPASDSKLSVNQYGTQNYLGLNTNVTIRIDPSMNSYAGLISSAIAQWNNVPNCRVKFFIYNGSGGYNLNISNSNLGSGVCGSAYFPMNGQPGSNVFINIGVISGLPSDQIQSVIIHELGHAIGLRHTNWIANGEPGGGTTAQGAHFAATNIIGTPTGGDPASIMNGATCGAAATVLSNYDKIAVQYIYPQSAPVAGTVPVFRYYSGSGTDHFYTTDYNELAQGSNNGYIFEGIGFFAFPNQVSGSVPVYRYFSGSAGDHFYTPNPTTPGGYVLERVAFYAYTSGINASVPVYRYYHGGTPAEIDHFYTKNQNEFYTGFGGFSLEDIHFYAY
jgi:hypothetical protein